RAPGEDRVLADDAGAHPGVVAEVDAIEQDPANDPRARADDAVVADDAELLDHRPPFHPAPGPDQHRLVQLHVRLDLTARPHPDIPIRPLGAGDIDLDLALQHVHVRPPLLVQAAD